METRGALRFILCLLLVDVNRAASRNDAGNGHQLRASINQPRRLEVEAVPGQVSLLEIVKGLQRRPTLAVVASEVQTERRDTGQTAHERMLLSDMGRLEDQLESWKEAEKNLERQMAQQTKTVESLKAHEVKAIHDEEVAAMVWWDCKMLMCILLASGIGFCIYTTSSASCPKTPNFNAAEPAQPAPRKVRAQPEFIEKDAQPEVEDNLQVMLTKPHVAPMEPVELATATATNQTEEGSHTVDEEEKEEKPIQHSNSDYTKCQYFSMDEDPAIMTCASPEEAWWAESTSAY